MNWSYWHQFWTMDGHALYVWGAYAVALGLMLTEVVLLLLRRRSILDYLGQLRHLRRHRHESTR